MDPEAALADLIDAVVSGQIATAQEHLDALMNWTDHGGWLPRDPRATP
jgi:hypothetical protein